MYLAEKDITLYLNFSEHDHVAYQIKGNHKCSNTVANILPADPPPPRTLGAKRIYFTFLEHGHFAYQIGGNPECKTQLQLFCPQTPPHDPGDQKVLTILDYGRIHGAQGLVIISKDSLNYKNVLHVLF